MNIEFLSLTHIIVTVAFVVALAFAFFKIGFKDGVQRATEHTLQSLSKSKIIEIVYDSKLKDKVIYSGFLHRYEDENVITAGLYDFFRAELLKGNVEAFILYKDILSQKDNHLKLIKKIEREEKDADV
jgi:hypothetical protein